MTKKKIIRKSNKTLNLFAEGGDTQPLPDQSSGGAFSSQNIGDSITGVVNAAGTIINSGMSNAQIADTSNLEGDISQAQSYKVSANTNDDLMNEWGKFSPMENVSYDDIRGGSTGQRLSNTVSAMGQGISAGATVGGPVGAVVGGIVGLGSAIGGWISGDKKAKRKTKELNKQIDISNARNLIALEDKAKNIDTQNDLNILANYAAYGGPLGLNTLAEGGRIYIKPSKKGTFTAAAKKHGKSVQEFASQVLANKENYSPAMVKKANFARNASKWKHADGGPLKKGKYEDWYKTVPADRNDTTSYNLKRAYELAPYGELEAWRTSSIKDLEEGKNHLRSVYLNPNTGVYEFMKSKNHPTLHFETDWYNSNYPEAIKFRKDYDLDMSGDYYKYVPKKKAFGGDLNTHGADFGNGITIIGNGGSHEENPMEGVPMGIAPDGTPNLVEQGEVKFNDYVFSNRLFATGGLLAVYNLPTTYANHSFADIAERLSKESSERPNDPISKKGLMSSMMRLQQAQEQLRMEKQNKKYAKGGHLFAIGGPAGRNPALYNQEEDYSIVPTGSKIIGNPFIDNETNYQILGNTSAPIEMLDETNHQNKNSSKQDKYLSWLRYAPVVGTGIGALTDTLGLTNKPDYSSADLVGNVADNLTNVGFTPIGNYLTYRPLDKSYYINKLNAAAGATRRAIINQSGGNRAAALAGLLAADYNALGRIGDFTRQAEEYNMAQRERVEAFNRATNQFNSEMELKAKMANKENDKLRLQAITTQAQLRDLADMRSSANKSANLTGFFDSLGEVGKEAFSRNMIKTNPALYYSIDSNGHITYKNGYDDLSEAEKKIVRDSAAKDAEDKNKKKAKGGYLTIKER